jgi:hypothetical protein
MVNTQDMANVAAVYRNGGVRIDPVTGAKTQVLSSEIANFVHLSNDVSGSYNESGTQFVKNRFGGKTGVDGGIFGSLHRHPDLVVATHHSDLNAAGNSGEGQKWINSLNKMNLVFPDNSNGPMAHTKRALGTALGSQSPRETRLHARPSPEALDLKLRRETTDSTLEAIKAKLHELTKEDKGFYMKTPNSAKNKDPLHKATLLLTAKDAYEKLKHYYLSPDNHQLHKIVVVDA